MSPTSLVVVLSSPSGTGKTTVIHEVLAREPDLLFSVSHTTRPPRSGEVEGVDYHFVKPGEFERLREGGGLLEWAEYAGALYGTSRQELDRARLANRDILLEIEVQGARQVSAELPGAVTIFVLPPDYASLEARLRGRRSETEASIARRLAAASEEVRHYGEFGYLVINGTVASACGEIRAILAAERLRSGGRGAAGGGTGAEARALAAAEEYRTERRRSLAERIVSTFPPLPGGAGVSAAGPPR